MTQQIFIRESKSQPLIFRNFNVLIYYDYYSSWKVNNGEKCCREIMHAMWKPQKFKYIYLLATLYVYTLTIPSAVAVYWAFGDELLNHSNAFSLLPKTGFRDAAVILMLIHQVTLVATLFFLFYKSQKVTCQILNIYLKRVYLY